MTGNKWSRLWRHWLHPRWRVQRHFPAAALARLSAAVGHSEAQHAGQIRFVIESQLPAAAIWQGLDARRRAWQWFGELGVWDTEHNSGVLVYVSFADHQVEIVADRGIAASVRAEQWQAVCRDMAAAFGQGRYLAGLEQGLAGVTAILAAHVPPPAVDAGNELPDEVVLR